MNEITALVTKARLYEVHVHIPDGLANCISGTP